MATSGMKRTGEEWLLAKPIISELYETHSLKQLMDIMAQQHQFQATQTSLVPLAFLSHWSLTLSQAKSLYV
jgi:hypothetical protein